MNGIFQALPFAGVLLSFAILPGMMPRFWHRHIASIIGAWVVLELAGQVLGHGVVAAASALGEITFAEFLPFIVLLLALYALGGGISISGGPWGRPAGNLLLLIIGTLLASIMGTIGAALVLIHPLLAANGHRYEKRHLVLAFIILVGNCGGALCPGRPAIAGRVPARGPVSSGRAISGLPLLLLAVPVLLLCLGVAVYLFAAGAVAGAPEIAHSRRIEYRAAGAADDRDSRWRGFGIRAM